VEIISSYFHLVCVQVYQESEVRFSLFELSPVLTDYPSQ